MQAIKEFLYSWKNKDLNVESTENSGIYIDEILGLRQEVEFLKKKNDTLKNTNIRLQKIQQEQRTYLRTMYKKIEKAFLEHTRKRYTSWEYNTRRYPGKSYEEINY